MLASDLHRGFSARTRAGVSTDVLAVLGIREVERRCRVVSIAPEMTVKLSETGVNKVVVLRLAIVLVEGEHEERPIAIERILCWCAMCETDIPRERAPKPVCTHPSTLTTKGEDGLSYEVTCMKCGAVIQSSDVLGNSKDFSPDQPGNPEHVEGLEAAAD